MSEIFTDTETFSPVDLKAHGTHRYADKAEIMIAQWAIDDGTPVVEDLTGASKARRPSEQLLDELNSPNNSVIFHNSSFDRTLARKAWGLVIPCDRIDDTMVRALAHGLPGGLEKLGELLGLPVDEQKDKRGRALIQLFCKPRPDGSRATRHTHPKEWSEFLQYSYMDIVSMRGVHRRLPSWNYRVGSPEHALWCLDQRTNDRGFQVDVELATAAITCAAKAQKDLARRAQLMTAGEVEKATKRDQLLKHILEWYGVTLPDLKKDTLRRRMEDPELPEAVRQLLAIRLEASMTSVGKYKALVNAVSADGRLRNTLQFAGAQRTGRWAGRIFQPQNMMRPTMKKDQIAMGIELIKAGIPEVLFPDVMSLTGNAVRGCIVAPPGKKLVIADLANIEGRGLVALAGEQWKLKAFREFDAGRGPDMYKLAYARSFGVEADTVDDEQRQVGKVMELACFGPETLVLTEHRGYIHILDVTTEDRLWDGMEWVTHKGLVPKGERETLDLAGIAVTADHSINTQGTWLPAQRLATCDSTLSQALATGSANLPYLVTPNPECCLCNAPAALNPTGFTATTCARVPVPAATSVPSSARITGASIFTATPTSFPKNPTACGCSIASLHASAAAPTQRTGATPTTAAEASRSTPVGSLTGKNICGILSPSTDGTRQTLSSIASTSTEGTNPATCGSSATPPTRATAARYVQCRTASSNSKQRMQTYDIAYSGPRNTFTVLSAEGPLLVHNCGYGGGVASYITFAAVYHMDLEKMADAVHRTAPKNSLAAAYGIHEWATKKKRSTFGLTQSVYVACEVLKSAWRAAHPTVVEFWNACGKAFADAVDHPGLAFRAGPLVFRRDGAWLRMRLPSGRYLCYLQPQKSESGELSYMGISQYTKQWCRVKTYPGKLVENATQGWARDVLAHNMPHVEESGYPLISSIHDELLTETPDSPEFTHEELSALMSRNPPWAPDVPLSAKGFETTRYRKE